MWDIKTYISPNTKVSFDMYSSIASILKDSADVNNLVNQIKTLQGVSGTPFIVLENSSGTGKTQMAFNLMARKDLKVLYVPCCSGPEMRPQSVYQIYEQRTAAFTRSINLDFPRVDNGSVANIKLNTELFTFGFILALLTDQDRFTGPASKYDVISTIEKMQKQCVVFLDEFPKLPKDEDEKSVAKLRFIRNIFRVFGFVVIISSTNGSARNSLGSFSHSRPGDQSLWCVVVPSLPRFIDVSGVRVSLRLKPFIDHSRPLFARAALDYYQQYPYNESANFVEYLDQMVSHLAEAFCKWKGNSLWFFVGQLTRPSLDPLTFLVH